MGELYNPFPKLPKNIRQIGDRDDVVRLYVEDYVSIYLKRLYPAGGQDLRVGLLLGNAEVHDGISYVFVDGALEMEEVTITGEKVTFTEAAWKKAYQSLEETFPKRTVQGWFLCGAPGCTLSPLNYYKQHGQYFSGKNQLMYLNGGIEGDESVYIASDDGFYKIKGYSVYYERNQMMQDYMILRKDARRVETGANDRVIRDFKHRMEGRKKEAVTWRGTARTLGMLCSVLSVAVLAGGVVMVNNYTKMKEMETALVSVLPSGVKGLKEYENKDEENEIVVEKIKGSIYPTEKGETAEQGIDGMTQSGASQAGTSQPGTEQAGTAPSGTGETGAAQSGTPQTGAAQSGKSQESAPQSAGAGTGQAASLSGQAKMEEESQPAAVKASAVPETAPAGENGGNSTAIQDYPVTSMKPGDTYTVGDGETLYGICFKLYDNIKYLDDICALNQISDVDKIIAGQQLILPDLTGIQ